MLVIISFRNIAVILTLANYESFKLVKDAVVQLTAEANTGIRFFKLKWGKEQANMKRIEITFPGSQGPRLRPLPGTEARPLPSYRPGIKSGI